MRDRSCTAAYTHSKNRRDLYEFGIERHLITAKLSSNACLLVASKLSSSASFPYENSGDIIDDRIALQTAL